MALPEHNVVKQCACLPWLAHAVMGLSLCRLPSGVAAIRWCDELVGGGLVAWQVPALLSNVWFAAVCVCVCVLQVKLQSQSSAAGAATFNGPLDAAKQVRQRYGKPVHIYRASVYAATALCTCGFPSAPAGIV